MFHLVTVIIGFAVCSFAEETQTSPSTDAAQVQGSEQIQIALDMHGLTIPEETQYSLKIHLLAIPLEVYSQTNPAEVIGYFQKNKMNLPAMHSNTVFNKEQSHCLLEAVQNDPSGNVYWIQTPKLSSGKETQSPASTATLNMESLQTIQSTAIETFQATVSEERQTVELRLTFRKDKDGKEWLAPMSATIPLGSSLVIHAACSAQVSAFGSDWGEWVDNLFSFEETVEKDSEIYLLVTPRIAHPEQEPLAVK